MSEKTKKTKLSPVEDFKSQSEYLRGTIGQEDADSSIDCFGKENVQLLKFHGTYQQDDRDARQAGRADKDKKPGKAYSFMVRTRVPGGRVTSDQLLAEMDLCDEIGNTTLRVTSRQGLQLHGVLKRDLKSTIRRINEVQLSTLAACGDVERNVMCCPAPHHHDQVHAEMQSLAEQLANHLAPRTTAYHELWLKDETTGEKELVGGGMNGHEVEPIYGKTYLPRKFKTAIGLPGDNCVDIYSHDLGLMAICRDFKIIGYNVLVGGGFGMTPSAKKTFPALARRMAFVTPDQVVDVATAVIKVQRDYGNRADRKVARLKYLIAEWGVARFKQEVEKYHGSPLPDPMEDDVFGFDDHMGWHEQGDGRWFHGLNIENGRIRDTEDFRLKTALRKICETYRPGIRLTSHQSMLLTDLEADNREEIETILKSHGVPLTEEISKARRWSMACVAWPTCGLAITESERALPGIIDELDVELARLGLSGEEFTLRMTGCPNGCSRPYNSDIGIVGRAAGKYTLLLGGRLLGDRLNFVYKDMVPHETVVAEIATILTFFKQSREEGETLGDFCARQGCDNLLAFAENYASQSAS
jgi:sulfite reductase (ferredoxin)